MRVYRVNELPAVLQPSACYLVANPDNPTQCTPYFTGHDGTPRTITNIHVGNTPPDDTSLLWLEPQ